MKKRDFLKRLLYLITLMPLAYALFSFMGFTKKREKIITFSHPKDTNGFVFKDGVYLINNDNKLYALNARCTHLGCIINFDPISRQFKCPCHGSRFDISGKPIAGPARKNLKLLKIIRKPNKDLEVKVRI